MIFSTSIHDGVSFAFHRELLDVNPSRQVTSFRLEIVGADRSAGTSSINIFREGFVDALPTTAGLLLPEEAADPIRKLVAHLLTRVAGGRTEAHFGALLDGGAEDESLEDAIRAAAKVLGISAPPTRTLAKHQPCGCVVCTCEDEIQCQGCGSRKCNTPDCVFDANGPTDRAIFEEG